MNGSHLLIAFFLRTSQDSSEGFKIPTQQAELRSVTESQSIEGQGLERGVLALLSEEALNYAQRALKCSDGTWS